MIGNGDLSGLGWNRGMHLADQLLARLIHAEHREAGIVGQPVDIQDKKSFSNPLPEPIKSSRKIIPKVS